MFIPLVLFRGLGEDLPKPLSLLQLWQDLQELSLPLLQRPLLSKNRCRVHPATNELVSTLCTVIQVRVFC